MEVKIVSVKLNKEDIEESAKVSLICEEIEDFPEIILSDDSTSDLKDFFNKIFNYIIENEKLLEFQFLDKGSTLFEKVAEDIITQINSEIKQSEDNFTEFITMKTDTREMAKIIF